MKNNTNNSKPETRNSKPYLSFFNILSMSMGFFGIQFGYALQNANASSILQTFGANMEQLSLFWLAAPLTGMIIQPIIGHYSDNTWTKLGRRRPFFLAGAIMAAIGLILMPNAGNFTNIFAPLIFGGLFLMVMDASFNVAMEPFRALVSDMVNNEQKTKGFAIQTSLIGAGAVLGSIFPWLLSKLGVLAVAPEGQITDNVKYSFYFGAIVIIFTILWTVFTTKEYTPQQLAEFNNDKKEYEKTSKSTIFDIFRDIVKMPKTMKQLSIVQFFSWIALFGMWVFTTPAIAQHIYNLPIADTSSKMYSDAKSWVGVMFGVYNGIAALYAFLIPIITKKFGRKLIHSFSLLCGALGLISIYFISDPKILLLSMVGIGIAWGSILAIPYAILAPALPSSKTGVYMGIFNIFITVPQIINGIFGGMIVKRIFDSQAIYALIASGIFLIVASIAVFWVKDNVEEKIKPIEIQ